MPQRLIALLTEQSLNRQHHEEVYFHQNQQHVMMMQWMTVLLGLCDHVVIPHVTIQGIHHFLFQ